MLLSTNLSKDLKFDLDELGLDSKPGFSGPIPVRKRVVEVTIQQDQTQHGAYSEATTQ